MYGSGVEYLGYDNEEKTLLVNQGMRNNVYFLKYQLENLVNLNCLLVLRQYMLKVSLTKLLTQPFLESFLTLEKNLEFFVLVRHRQQ